MIIRLLLVAEVVVPPAMLPQPDLTCRYKMQVIQAIKELWKIATDASGVYLHRYL